MTYDLSSRFSVSTVATTSSNATSLFSSISSFASLDDFHFPSSSSIPKPPPRTSSITLASTKTYSTGQRSHRKPAPLLLASSHKQSIDEEDYFNCKDSLRCSGILTRRCFCGSAVRASEGRGVEIYCSKECARKDALYALEGRSPASTASDEDEDEDEDANFPVTPTNVLVSSPPETPTRKSRVDERKLSEIGASHYRRMEAMGWYDAPLRTARSGSLPVELTVAHDSKDGPSPGSRGKETAASRRKTQFFEVPIYMGSPF